MPFGLLGGSFDPFHLGHAWLVDAALRHGGCSRVWVVPAPHPPHKPDVALTPFAHRVAMARLALAGRSDVLVSEFEANRTGPSYTADTLRELHLLILEADGWVLILGADMAADFASWHQPGEIRRLASLAVATRAGARIPEGLAP